jgi:hypothetical protein
LLPLKKSWDWSPSRVYSLLWPTVPSPLTKALGTPFFGFSWPTAGLPSRLARNYLSDTRLGSSLPATPTPPSALTTPPSPLYILGLESRSRWQLQISQPWHIASKEFAVTCKHLSQKLTSPPRTWSLSDPFSTSIPLVTWPAGLPFVWVSSPSFDPETWFLNLKENGNPVPTSRIAMSILLSGVQSFQSASPKLRNLMAPLSKYPSHISQDPLSVLSSPSTASSPSCPSPMVNCCSPPWPRIGSRIPNFGFLSARYAEGFFYWVFGFVLSVSVRYWFSTLARVFLP